MGADRLYGIIFAGIVQSDLVVVRILDLGAKVNMGVLWLRCSKGESFSSVPLGIADSAELIQLIALPLLDYEVLAFFDLLFLESIGRGRRYDQLQRERTEQAKAGRHQALCRSVPI